MPKRGPFLLGLIAAALACASLAAGGPPQDLPDAFRTSWSSFHELRDFYTPIFTNLQDFFGRVSERALYVLNATALIAAYVMAALVYFKDWKSRAAVLAAGAAVFGFSGPFFLLHAGTLAGLAALLYVSGVILLRLRRLEGLAGLSMAAAAAFFPFYAVAFLPGLCLRRGKWLLGFLLGGLLLYGAAYGSWETFFRTHYPHWFAGARVAINASVTEFFAGNASRLVAEGKAAWFITFAQWAAAAALAAACAWFVEEPAPARAGEEEDRSWPFALMLPLMLWVPASLSALALVALLPFLPVFAWRWERAAAWPERAALLLAAFGAAFTQAWGEDFAPLGVFLLVPGLLAAEILARRGAPASLEGGESIELESLGAFFRSVLRPADRRRRELARGALLAAFCGLALYGWLQASILPVLVLWLCALIMMFAALGGRTLCWTFPAFQRTDWLIAAGLMLFAAPFYILANYEIPVQVNSDELIAFNFYRQLMSQPNPDVLGVARVYFCVPYGSFVSVAAIAQLADGLHFGSARFACGLYSVAATGVFYLVMRSWRSRTFAIAATLLFASSHALVGVSRQTLVNNIPLFVGACALGTLMYAFRRRSAPLLFLGGVVAGAGAYCYYSARVYPLVWFAFLGVYWLGARPRFDFRRLLHATALTGFGLAMCMAPIMLSVFNARDQAFDYSRQQSVFYPEGRELTRYWENTDDTGTALAKNALHGLIAFNSNESDRSNMYVNVGYGIVDPITGVLLWLGLWRIFRKRRRSRADLLAAVGLLAVWVPLSLFTTKNPAFCRLLAVLPFVCYLAVEGARRVLFRYRWPRATLVLVALVIVAWNAKIYWNLYEKGRTEGCGAGSSVRYVAAGSRVPGKIWYVIMDDKYPYYWFGGQGWGIWFRQFKGPTQRVELIASDAFLEGHELFQPEKRPCAVMMHRDLWALCRDRMMQAYPDLKAVSVTPTGEYLALEFPSTAEARITITPTW